jgi:hypothetical protein
MHWWDPVAANPSHLRFRCGNHSACFDPDLLGVAGVHVDSTARAVGGTWKPLTAWYHDGGEGAVGVDNTAMSGSLGATTSSVTSSMTSSTSVASSSNEEERDSEDGLPESAIQVNRGSLLSLYSIMPRLLKGKPGFRSAGHPISEAGAVAGGTSDEIWGSWIMMLA